MDLVMPKLGLTMTEGTITRWLKAEGEGVRQGEILFEFESEKSALEFESPADGVLGQILAREGQTVPCGTPIAILETSDEAKGVTPVWDEPLKSDQAVDVSIGQRQPISRPSTPPLGHAVSATPAAKRRARELALDLSAVSGRGPQGRVHTVDVEAHASRLGAGDLVTQEEPRAATPVAKRLASEAGLDWRQIPGSGPGGRVVKEDVLRAIQPVADSMGYSPHQQTIPLSGVRGVVARRMSESAFTAPHVTLFTEADATALVEARAQLNAELAASGSRERDTRISYDTLLVAVTARALREYPHLNACLVDGEIRLYGDVHIALAVDTEHGLLAPVIQDADKLDLVSIQHTSDELNQRALSGKSLPDDLVGGTFTLTNLGMFDIDGFTPIINQPQAAILGIGRIMPRAVVIDNELAVRHMMTLSLSFDHRIVDGGPAARFLQRIKRLVERPFALVIPA